MPLSDKNDAAGIKDSDSVWLPSSPHTSLNDARVMWLHRLVLLAAITMIGHLEGYHVDKDAPLGRHRRRG